MNTTQELLQNLLDGRRSIYELSPQWVRPQAEVEEMLRQILLKTPSAYNAQPVRIMLLTGQNHTAHWQVVEDALIAHVGREAYDNRTRNKVHKAFMNGVATLLFLDYTPATEALQQKYPSYAHNFPLWAEQVQGSHQALVWSALAHMGFGANLQHYIGFADKEIKERLLIPGELRLVAQMPFGAPAAAPMPIEKLPIEQLLTVK